MSFDRSVRLSLLSFVATGGLLSGLIFIGISSTFSYMLSERGVNISAITNILLATLPYSWKFAISPFIKNLLIRFEKSNPIKYVALIAQSIMIAGFSSLGLFESNGSLYVSGIVILMIVLAAAVYDILRSHIKLSMFEKKDFGLVTGIENAGFRIGMFVGGACIIYLANSTSWTYAFFIFGLSISLISFQTLFLKCKDEIHEEVIHSVKDDFRFCGKYLKTCHVFYLFLILLAFKFTDSCTVSLKPMLMHHLGINRIDFANISYLLGLFTMILSGLLAGAVSRRYGTKKCIPASFIAHIVVALIFIYLCMGNPSILSITILINIATFIFGFSGVVFRTYIAEAANRDVNTYTILLSVGSIIRIASYSLSGFLVELLSWEAVYFLCVISNIPALLIYRKYKSKKLTKL